MTTSKEERSAPFEVLEPFNFADGRRLAYVRYVISANGEARCIDAREAFKVTCPFPGGGKVVAYFDTEDQAKAFSAEEAVYGNKISIERVEVPELPADVRAELGARP